MSQNPNILQLPSSPSKRCLDRFSILEDDEQDDDGNVSYWALLQKFLQQPVTSCAALINILETISVTVRGSSGPAGDYGTLRAFIERTRPESFFTSTWPAIVSATLSLPQQSIGSPLSKLSQGATLRFTRYHCASLVAHQFLCSFDSPRDDFFDFSVWYGSGQRHPAAVETYLEALFTYFETIGVYENSPGEVIEYSLHSLDTVGGKTKLQALNEAPLKPITIVRVDKYSTQQHELAYQIESGAVVIAANKDIGFGESATQEELYVGNSPEACAAVLFTPRLAPDQALLIEGARPMLRIDGQRRNISWRHLDADERRGGRMLFMDALEMDEVDAEGLLPDLFPENIERELVKAYTAFSSWSGTASPCKVWTGLWGCGAFGGEPAVKVLILWMAASLAGKELQLVLDRSEEAFADKLGRFVKRVPTTWSVGQLRDLLDSVPKDLARFGVIDWLDGYNDLP